MSFMPLDFQIDKRQAAFINSRGESQIVPQQHMIVVTDKNGKEFRVNPSVSKNYEIHQLQEIMDSFNEVATTNNLEVTTVMTNPNNASLLIQARYNQTQFLNEDHDVNVVFYSEHTGKRQTFLGLHMMRIACENQIPAMYKEKQRHILTAKHYKNSMLEVSKISNLLEEIPNSVNLYNQRMEQLAEKKISYERFIQLLAQRSGIHTDDKDRMNRLNRKWHDAYYHNDNNAIATGTAYKALHAVTYMNTHNVSETAFKKDRIFNVKADDSLKMMNFLLAA